MKGAKVFVTGGSGLLGSKVAAIASKEFEVAATFWKNRVEADFDLLPLDITDKEAVSKRIRDFAPDFVVHTAAMTNVDACEEQPEMARKINAAGTRNVVEACEKVGAKLAYISTDYVFDGEKGSYVEEDEPNPISQYGGTKLEGEKAVEEVCPDYIIGRVSVLYGWGPSEKPNFVTWIIDSLKMGQQINIVTDQFASPTFADSTAELLVEMLKRDLRGTFHISGRERIDRYGFALKTAEVFGLEKRLIIPTRTEGLKQKARRPRDSSLNVAKVEKAMGTKLYGVEKGLREMRNKR